MIDDLVIGSGMAGLATAALLARSGRRVRLLEAHDAPGGYAHTFTVQGYRFCAQVHYLFGCGEGEVVHRLLTRVGLADTVRFLRLDPEGFDHVVVAGDRFRIPSGLEKQRDRLARRFPEHAEALRRYFALVHDVREELDRLPEDPGLVDWLAAPLRLPHLLRHRASTLGDVFDAHGFPPRLRAFLAGQCGDYLLSPARAPFPLHTLVTTSYDRGAYYPERHVHHLVESLASVVADTPGCEVRYGQEVVALLTRDGRVIGARTRDGTLHEAARVVANLDPARTASLLGPEPAPATWSERLDYPYSTSAFSLYLGLDDGLDLRAAGFGPWNTWHYPSNDLDGIYRRQDEDDLTDPWMFLATPTLVSDAPGLTPPGGQILQVATSAPFAPWDALKRRDPAAYKQRRREVADGMLARIERDYLPGLTQHLVVRVEGTPVDNAAFVGAPAGAAYGAELDADHLRFPRVDFATPYENLFLVNATAGYPSVGGTVTSALALFARLTGEQA